MIVGIDLGTTNSVISFLKEKQPQTISIDGEVLLPSVISLTEDGFIVGRTAKNMAILEPEKTVLSVKRKMGEDIEIQVGDRKMSPEEVSAVILKKLKHEAVKELGLPEGEILSVVITVPAYFIESQREATKRAAEMAGLKVERIINEPTAAGLAFGLSSMEEAMYAVYDFGGGTFDVSVIESNAGLIEVLASTGNNLLGGDDLDDLLSEYIWSFFVGKNKMNNPPKNAKVNARLKHISEKVKIELSSKDEYEIQESFFYQYQDNNYHLELTITRAVFEKLIEEKVKETIKHLEKAIEEARIKESELDGIILVGGSSRIPLVARKIEERFKISPMLIDHPNEAIAHGATIQGAIIEDIDIDTILVDITPHSLGVGALDETSFSEVDYFGGGEPDLRAVPIISKNTPIPASRTKVFHSASPFQKEYHLTLFQGEYPRMADNNVIGEMILKVKNPPEDSKVEVTFSLDINGILNVYAMETTTRQDVNAEFKSSRGYKAKKLTLDNEVLLSMSQANQTLITRAEKALQSLKNKEDKNELEEIIEKYKTAHFSGNQEVATQAESELLDLLYYLEDEN